MGKVGIAWCPYQLTAVLAIHFRHDGLRFFARAIQATLRNTQLITMRRAITQSPPHL
jgi:hypothetical protein